MKKHLTILFTVCSFLTYSQQQYKYGIITTQEKEMKSYEKDSTASAVVLYEESKNTFFEKNNRIYLKIEVYKKIKILKREGFSYSDVEINLYNNDKMKETIGKVKGITHNETETFYLDKKNIYQTVNSKNNTTTSFTLPNIKKGSIIEYYYIVESPFLFKLNGWDFQSSIPKVESVYKAEIPGNYVYNRRLVGLLNLDTNDSSLKKRCFKIDGFSEAADCEVLKYSMKNVPAFIEEEYLTSKENFLAKIIFELSEFRGFDGRTTNYTKTWKDVDKDFQRDGDIGGQLKKKSFFQKLLPEKITSISDPVERAKQVYYFIQNHYSWNEKYSLFRDMNVKKAYNEKVGSVGEINMSLINALKACNIESKMALLSTRNNGLPTKIHPVITEFNYIVAEISIGNKSYFLDATDKNLPFGILPYRCLNSYARIMDFKKGSYWKKIEPPLKNSDKIQMLLSIDEDNIFKGNMRIMQSGYQAIDKRRKLNDLSEEEYLSELEDDQEILEIESYKNYDFDNQELPLKEEFDITLDFESEGTANKIFLNPFFIDKIGENPFKLESRNYPVDFGYPRNYEFSVTLDIPENYIVESLPPNKSVKLPNEKGVFIYKINQASEKINLRFTYSLNIPYFHKSEYKYLKAFFKHMINTQNQSIELKKK